MTNKTEYCIIVVRLYLRGVNVEKAFKLTAYLKSLDLKKRILPSLIVAFLNPFVLFFSIPFDIFGNNVGEFLFSAKDFLPTLFIIVAIATIILFTLVFFLPKKAYRVASALLITFAFLFFLQGTYLNGAMMSLAGDNLGVEEIPLANQIINLAIWLIFLAAAVVLALMKDEKRIFSTIAMIVVAVVAATQVMTPVSLALTNKDIFLTAHERAERENKQIVPTFITTKNLNTVSKTNNIYYFCIDRFDANYAKDALEKYPNLYDELNGFTWFQDHIASYGHTYPAVTQMLTNVEHTMDQMRTDYLIDAYEEETPMDILADNGYQVNVYTQSYHAYVDACYFPDYVGNKSLMDNFKVTDKLELSMQLIKMSLYRAFPQLLKNVVGDVKSSSCNELVEMTDNQSNNQYSLDMKKVYDFITNNEVENVDTKVFKFIHLEGCHSLDYNENWGSPEGCDILTTVYSSFQIVDKYISIMKDLGVYDAATIIITGDHSHPVNDVTALDGPRMTALFAKPSGSSEEPLRISQAQTSHDNLWATIFKSEGIPTEEDFGKSVFEIPENEDQLRRYVWHTYDTPVEVYTYEINGSGWEFANWTVVEHVKIKGRNLMD